MHYLFILKIFIQLSNIYIYIYMSVMYLYYKNKNIINFCKNKMRILILALITLQLVFSKSLLKNSKDLCTYQSSEWIGTIKYINKRAQGGAI